MPRQQPKKRSNGIATLQKILDAAAEISSERGYEGTSISLVSKRSGFTASSIYWHFKDKDDLFAAVIERSFDTWLKALSEFEDLDENASLVEQITHHVKQRSHAVSAAPDFLRLGLMLSLEKRPLEPTARSMFLKVRSQAYRHSVEIYTKLLPELGATAIRHIASLSISLTDGLFVAQQVEDETADLIDHHEPQAAALLGLIQHYQRQ